MVRERGECLIVVAGLRVRRGQRGHGRQQRVVAGAGEVVAFVGRGRGHHDVGVFGHRGPVRVVYHDGVDPGQRAPQPGQVLVVMEGVAAGPVHAADVREGESLPVEVVRLAGVQQHVADGRHRDEGRDGVGPLRERRQRAPQRRQARFVHRAVAVPEAAAGQADLAQHRRQRQAHPRRLLAVPDALQRPAHRHQRAAGGHPAGQCAQRVGRQPADLFGPLRRFRDAVVGAQQIALEPVVARAVACQEGAVGQGLGGQHVGQGEHDRHIGARYRGQPLAIAVDVVAQRD